jgi:hypothetical protein
MNFTKGARRWRLQRASEPHMQPSTAADHCAAIHGGRSSASSPPAVRQYPWLAVSRSPTQAALRRGAWSIPGDVSSPASIATRPFAHAADIFTSGRRAAQAPPPMAARFVVAQVCAPARILPSVSGTKHGERPTLLTTLHWAPHDTGGDGRRDGECRRMPPRTPPGERGLM